MSACVCVKVCACVCVCVAVGLGRRQSPKGKWGPISSSVGMGSWAVKPFKS